MGHAAGVVVSLTGYDQECAERRALNARLDQYDAAGVELMAKYPSLRLRTHETPSEQPDRKPELARAECGNCRAICLWPDVLLLEGFVETCPACGVKHCSWHRMDGQASNDAAILRRQAQMDATLEKFKGWPMSMMANFTSIKGSSGRPTLTAPETLAELASGLLNLIWTAIPTDYDDPLGKGVSATLQAAFDLGQRQAARPENIFATAKVDELEKHLAEARAAHQSSQATAIMALAERDRMGDTLDACVGQLAKSIERESNKRLAVDQLAEAMTKLEQRLLDAGLAATFEPAADVLARLATRRDAYLRHGMNLGADISTPAQPRSAGIGRTWQDGARRDLL
jgi:hypothetical protein